MGSAGAFPAARASAGSGRSLRCRAMDLERVLQVARTAVEAAGRVSLPHWRRGVEVETKEDRSPVTVADRESEAAILRVIDQHFPDHAILAEESGARAGRAGHRWIVDPIDGTRGFTRGGKFWGSLVAFELDGEVVAGAMGLPALGDVYWAARGQGCFRNGERLRVSSLTEWRDCTVSLGELGPLFSPPHGERVIELVRSAALGRCYGDVMGVAMVLTGLADVWLEAGVKPWDLAPSKILLEEAGGRFTNFSGTGSLEPGSAIGGNPALHAHALKILGG